MLLVLQIFILLSPAAVCLVWLAESGRLRRGLRETVRLLRALPPDRAAVLAALVLWATVSGGDKQMPAPPAAPAWPADAGMQAGGDSEAFLLDEPEGFPWGMPLWPFDAIISNAVAGMSATNVPPIPDAMLDSGLALYRAATNVAIEARASNAVPAYAWECHAADNRGLEFALPFAFPLGANAYGRIGVLSNGRLSFGFHTLHRRTPDGLPFATPYPVATLAPLWGPYGLLPSAGRGVWAQGDSNRFTVCWQDMLLHGDTNLPATAQCDLLPGGAVRFRYGGMPGGAATNSTVGVQNLGPGWSLGAAAPVSAGLELSLRPVAASGWAEADSDGDGLTNFEEFMIGTAEQLADTDGDGPSDAWEPAHGFDPLAPQLPDPEPDADNDGVPDRWAQWMGERLGDATNYYSAASLCADADGDGFTGWYELFALGSSPDLAAYPGTAPTGFVDVVAVVTSSRPCVLRLTNGAESVEIPWMPGLSPERFRLRLEVGKAFQTEFSRVPSDTAFPANGFWWAAVSFESPDLPTSEPAVADGVVTYDAGTVRVTGADRGGDWWTTPGVVAIPALRVEVRLIVLDGPQTFCHSAAQAEIALASNSLHTGNLIWFSEPVGIVGEVDPLVFDPREVAPGLYELFAYSEENPLVWGSTHVAVSHLGLADTTLYVDASDTNLTTIGLSGDTYPVTGITVSSDPPGISNLSFRASDLEPGTYTVTVGNGSCETREVEVTVLSVDSVEAYCDKFGASGSFGVNPEIFAGGQTDFGQPDQPPPYWWLPGTYANPSSQVLKVFFKYIKDSNDEPDPFDIDLKANILPESIPDEDLNITWVNWAGPSASGSFDKTDEREVKFQNPTKGGLYKFRMEMEIQPYHIMASDAWVLLPKAGGEIADWIVSEVPSLVTRASDWEDVVRAVAVSNGLNPNTFLETAWKAIATCDFDYQGIVGSPTKRYSFTDADRPVGHTPDSGIPGMAGAKGNGDWDEPSYATLKGIVIHRAKINNAMYAVWGRQLGYTENQLKGGAIWNAMSRGLWDDSTSQNAVALGSDLYNAHTSSGSLAAILTKTRAKQIQSPDTPTGLNDVNLWPDTTSVSSGFWLPTMPTDYDSLDEGENEMPRGRLL